MARRNRTTPGTPQAVAKAAKIAEEIHAEVYGKPQDEETPKQEVDAEAPDEQEASDGDDNQPVDPQDEPAAEDTSASAASEEPLEFKSTRDEEDWKVKYETLQGKYNAEVPRLAQDNRTLRSQLQDLAEKVESLESAKPEVEQPKKINVVSEQDVLDYGEDLIDLIQRVAKSEVTSVEATLKPELETIKGQVQQTTKKQATDSVYAVLNREVQDWRDINRSEDFLEWLQQSDPYAGGVRGDILNDAFKKGDAERVAAFFKGFVAEKQTVTPAPNQESAREGRKPQVNLEQLAGPSNGTGSAAQPATTQRQPEIWNRADISRFYNDVASGKYAKNPERKAQIESLIASAMEEGRIQ
jgi:hypothetical protein